MAEASIRIKLGQLEIDYQGEAAFLKTELLKTVKELLDLQTAALPADDADEDKGPARAPKRRSGKYDHSTSTIAATMGAKSGPHLVKAAAGHLHFVKGMSKYTRAELIAEMRRATSYYKNTYNNNLSSYLSRLTKSEDLREVGNDTYALSATAIGEIESKLAEAK